MCRKSLLRIPPSLRSLLMLLLLQLLSPSVFSLPSQAPASPGAADFNAGMAHMRAGNPDRAERSFERAIEKEPRNGTYHLWLGNAVGQQAQNASVVRQPFMARRIRNSFERAVALDPNLLDARDGLIQFYLAAPSVMGGDVNKAREQQAEIAKRDVVRGHIAAANIAWHGRDTVATERALRAAVAAAPDSAAPVLSLGARQYNWGRPADAFATYEGFLRRHPQNIPVRYQYGRLAALTGENLTTAERHLRGILAVEEWPPNNFSPSKAAAHARLGDVLRRQGKRDEARAAYNTALGLDANLQLAKDGLRALN
ncbi:MAG: tetratricopeptide repeat protein [Gemmatimonadaceae bacterium]|nr:tetratricopeptide repeat protein [Gemmatimonadaceae bacterium]MCW5827562.1 tetratricopeptide repeat protein [Gemmatimonadaceae bacterium]